LFVFAGPHRLLLERGTLPGKMFGAGDYRAGWYLIEDHVVELDDPMGLEPQVKTTSVLKMRL
jgi:hypothetical protein